jgi:hypothetical protein
MRSKIAFILAVAVLAMPFTACTVKKTEEGELPKVEGGKLPEYDVQPAEVQVNTTPVQVTVPDVDVSTEKKTVEVPNVDIKTPTPAPAASPPGGN